MLILGPSEVHGVGVFTTKRIPAGARVDLFRADDYRFVRDPKGEEKKLCQRFCVRDGDGYHCPKHWNRMSIGWYLNDSAEPNLSHDDYVYRARRTIRAGEELLIDYDEL